MKLKAVAQAMKIVRATAFFIQKTDNLQWLL